MPDDPTAPAPAVAGEVIAAGERLETATIAARVPGAPSIVLLHEGLGSVAMWRTFPAALAARTGCAVFAYSRRGYGRSEPLRGPREPDYLHREAQIVLPAVLDAVGIGRPILVGHSDGASIAIVFAGTWPHRARALVLEAPHVVVEDVSIASIAAARERYATTDLRARLARYHRDVDGAFRGWNDIWLDPRFRAWDITPFLARIDVPVLVLQGDADEFGTRAQADAIAAAVRGTRVVMLAGCGHRPHRDRLAEVLAETARVVARVHG